MNDKDEKPDGQNEQLNKAVQDLQRAEHRLDEAKEAMVRAEDDVKEAVEEVKEAEHHERFAFFIDNIPYETDQRCLTGAQIKAKVAGWPSGYGLVLEGHGNDPDRLIGDDEIVDLADHAPRRFTRVPPATFGGE